MLEDTRHIPTRSDTGTYSSHDRRRPLPRAIRGLLVASCLFSLLAGYTWYRWQSATLFPLRPSEHTPHWVKAPGEERYTGYFRKEIFLPRIHETVD